MNKRKKKENFHNIIDGIKKGMKIKQQIKIDYCYHQHDVTFYCKRLNHTIRPVNPKMKLFPVT